MKARVRNLSIFKYFAKFPIVDTSTRIWKIKFFPFFIFMIIKILIPIIFTALLMIIKTKIKYVCYPSTKCYFLLSLDFIGFVFKSILTHFCIKFLIYCYLYQKVATRNKLLKKHSYSKLFEINLDIKCQLIKIMHYLTKKLGFVFSFPRLWNFDAHYQVGMSK